MNRQTIDSIRKAASDAAQSHICSRCKALLPDFAVLAPGAPICYSQASCDANRAAIVHTLNKGSK